MIATAVQFILIGIMVMLRHFPFYAPLVFPDPAYYGIKLAVLFGGLALYALLSAFAARLSMKRFEEVDL